MSTVTSYWRQFSTPSSWAFLAVLLRQVATENNVILPESSLNTHFTRDKRSDYGKNLLFFIREIYDMLSRDFALSLLEIFLANLFLSKYYKNGNTTYQLHIHKTP